MPRYFDPTCTVDILKEKIQEAINKYCEESNFYQDLYHNHPIINKDLSKVNFDTENFWEPTEEPFGDYKALLGYNTLPNGMAYVGFQAGGDWQYPPFFLYYFDGKNLRGYIPKNGNAWNYKTNEAIGNDHDEDAKFLKKYLPIDDADPDDDPEIDSSDADVLIDIELMKEDIQERILPKSNKEVKVNYSKFGKQVYEAYFKTLEASKLGFKVNLTRLSGEYYEIFGQEVENLLKELINDEPKGNGWEIPRNL